MVDERAAEGGDGAHLLHPEIGDADPHHHGSQHEGSDEEFLSQEEVIPRETPRRAPPQKEGSRPRGSIILIATLACITILAASLGLTWVMGRYSLYEIQGPSMEPTVSQGDSIVLHHEEKLHRGAIVIFTKPSEWEHSSGDGRLLIKRVLGLPGDAIALRNKNLYVNGEKVRTLPEGYECPRGDQELKLAPGEIFAVGDNAQVSMDSRRALCTQGAEKAVVHISSLVNQGNISLTL